MISELRNSVRSRISLRSKHLEKLEEQKANLNEIKSKITNQKKLIHRKNSIPHSISNSDPDDNSKRNFSLQAILNLCPQN